MVVRGTPIWIVSVSRRRIVIRLIIRMESLVRRVRFRRCRSLIPMSAVVLSPLPVRVVVRSLMISELIRFVVILIEKLFVFLRKRIVSRLRVSVGLRGLRSRLV